VYNYAQAISHLFPQLERSMRQTEFFEDQNDAGHQQFRAALPIRPLAHDYFAAADGQLGGIMKAYREWRISGDSAWLRNLFPRIKGSMDYCIGVWDPQHTGKPYEPRHNTYDIEFSGTDGFSTSFYLGALEAYIRMATYMGEDVATYQQIFEGQVAKGLDIVRTCRKRYDGRVRNPFDEYECGYWYARAMASYALLEALTGVRYDAVTKTLYVDSKIGDFTSFLSTATGFGDVVYKNGKTTLEVVYGQIPVQKTIKDQ
jgi:hypothetical protein